MFNILLLLTAIYSINSIGFGQQNNNISEPTGSIFCLKDSSLFAVLSPTGNPMTIFPILTDSKVAIITQGNVIYQGIEPRYPIIATINYLREYNDSAWGNNVFQAPFVYNRENLIIIGTSQQGEKLLLTDSRTRSKLFILRLKKHRNQSIEKLELFYNGGFNIHSATISDDEKHLVFSSQRVGSKGGYDLFTTYLDDNSKYLKIKNLGNNINSSANEINPCFGLNDTVLYFASDRTSGRGGFDIYISNREMGGMWLAAENLGNDINSSADETRLLAIGLSTLSMLTRNGKQIITSIKDIKKPLQTAKSDKTKHTLKPQSKKKISPTIKGFVNLPNSSDSRKIQVSIIEKSGTLYGTTNIAPDTHIYTFTDLPDNEFVISVSGESIKTTSQHINIPKKYSYPVFIVDFETELTDSRNSSYSYTYNSNSTTIDLLTYDEIKSWLSNKYNYISIEILSCATPTGTIPSLTQSRLSDIRKAISPLICNNTAIYETKHRAYYTTDNLELLPEYRTVTIKAAEPQYPQYSVFDISDKKNIKQMPEYKYYTIVLTDRTDDLCPEKITQLNNLGYTNLWIDNSGKRDNYCMGKYRSYHQAIQHKQKATDIFVGAYIALYDENKNRLKVVKEDKNSADIAENERYYVQIKATSQLIDIQQYPESDNICTILDNKGVYRYVYIFDSFDRAKQKQKELKVNGFGTTSLLLITK